MKALEAIYRVTYLIQKSGAAEETTGQGNGESDGWGQSYQITIFIVELQTLQIWQKT